jgi:hypothetical protein
LLAALVVGGGAFVASAADFTVTTPGGQFAFQINGVNSPALTLVRGRTYTFAVSTTPGFHPFRIRSTGVVNNNISSGTMTYTVPLDNANYTYDCTVHGASMQGQILTVEPPAPPVIRILGLTINLDNIILTSLGTNTWSVNPEYTTNATSTNWFSLTVQTNRFLSGTNETICGRPAGENIFIRIRSEETE